MRSSRDPVADSDSRGMVGAGGGGGGVGMKGVGVTMLEMKMLEVVRLRE